MAEQVCERRVLRSVSSADEAYELWVEVRGDVLVIGEDTQGAQTEAAYGEPWHRSMIEVDTAQFARSFGGEVPEVFFAQDDTMLCDLMDAFDVHGVPYRFVGFGSEGVASLRG